MPKINMAGIDKFRKNGSYNKFDGKRSERGAFGTVPGKFIIFHYNSLGKKFFANSLQTDFLNM